MTEYGSTFQLEKLAVTLNALRTAREPHATCNPGNELARQNKENAKAYLGALDDVARRMGLVVKTTYGLPEGSGL